MTTVKIGNKELTGTKSNIFYIFWFQLIALQYESSWLKRFHGYNEQISMVL